MPLLITNMADCGCTGPLIFKPAQYYQEISNWMWFLSSKPIQYIYMVISFFKQEHKKE